MILAHDLIHICARQVFRQRRRNMGVVLAVALGTASLIAILTLGSEVKHSINRDLDLLGGATLIKASFTSALDTTLPPQFFQPKTLSEVRRLPGVESASVSTEKIDHVPLFWRMKQLGIPVSGVDAEFWSVTNLRPSAGVLFTSADVENQARVCVLGDELAKTLFGNEDPLGQYVPIRSDVYKVIGIVGGLQLGDRKKALFLPLSVATGRLPGMIADRLVVRCTSLDEVPVVSNALASLLSASHSPKYLRVEIAWQQLERVTAIIWWIQLFVGISIAATLVLGGFGILNGMMSSVAARTREIGLKKAMGAEEADIMVQFLSESVVLSLGAAILGVLLGFVAVQAAGRYLESAPSMLRFLGYSGMSLAFSVALGVAAGYYPALHAARMDAVMAIRYE